MSVMEESFRWYGPNDTVSLAYIKQAGATSVINSLHEIAYGDAWPYEAIMQRKRIIEAEGLRWAAVESVPVHEDIKTRTGRYEEYIENYKTSLINLGKAGVDVVIYNFMPVLDWVRTDLAYKLEDGTECLYFDPYQFAAFDMYLLKREGAEKDYTPEQQEKAKAFFDSLSEEGRKSFERDLIDVFPGMKLGFTIDDVRAMLAKYENIDRDTLKKHYRLFLEEVIPVAAKAGVRMAVHPDDPPWNIMGLPRIVSCADDIRDLLAMVGRSGQRPLFLHGQLQRPGGQRSARHDKGVRQPYTGGSSEKHETSRQRGIFRSGPSERIGGYVRSCQSPARRDGRPQKDGSFRLEADLPARSRSYHAGRPLETSR